MSKLEMQQCVLGQVFTNCYFLKNKKTGELLIVDPGDYAEKVFQKVALMQGKPVGILLTHGHFDHIMAVKEVKEKYQIPVYACRQEEAMLAEPTVDVYKRQVQDREEIRRYLYGTVEELASPHLMKDVDKAVEILRKDVYKRQGKSRLYIFY